MDEKRRKQASFPERRCSECGKAFSPRSGATKYCSKGCKLSARRKQEALSYRRKHPNARPIEKIGMSTSNFEIIGDVLQITTSKGDVILADAAEADILRSLSWSVSKTGYAVAYCNGKIQKMHRIILGEQLSDGDDVDHINRKKLDNRRQNIRVCKRAENLRNSGERRNNSGHTGITVMKNGSYRASIALDGEQIHLGVYKTLEEAIQAREDGESAYHGSYARHIGTKLAEKENTKKGMQHYENERKSPEPQ